MDAPARRSAFFPELTAIGIVMLLVLAATLLPADGAARREPTRWAVIIGVSDYEHFEDAIGGDLPGAALDARAVRDVVVARWSVPAANVRLLLDADAARADIEHALSEWLPAVVEPGDIVLFYFSGHGSQAWDVDGDEEDGLDETIAPHDALPHSTERDITDDEIGEWLTSLRTDNVIAILDNCHSGTGTRAAMRHARPRVLARDIHSVPRPALVRGVPQRRGGVPQRRDGSARLFGPGVLEMAAAQADQVAVEIAWPHEDGGAVWGGAFTTLLVRQLWAAPPGTTYEDLFRATHHEMRRLGFGQDPRLSVEGASQAVFGLAGRPSAERVGRSAWAVESAADGDVILRPAGGLAPGAILQTANGLLRVNDIRGDRAHAHALGAAWRPASGDSAVLIAMEPPAGAVRVELSGFDAEERADMLPQLADVAEPLPPGASAGPGDLIIRAAPGGFDVIGMDGTVRHALRGPDPRVRTQLAEALRRESDARQLALLDNPARPFPLTVTMIGGLSTLAIGDPVEMRVQSGRDGHLTLIDLGTDGTITVLFPGGAQSDGRIRAGVSVGIPTPGMRAAGETFAAVPPSGAGIVRAFVTPRPLALPRDGTAVSATAVLRSLAEAAGEDNARAPVGMAAGLLPLPGWATAVLHYRIEP